MHFPRPILLALAFACLGMAERQPEVTVRFYAEANSRDSEVFSTPVKLGSPPHDAFLEKVASINERQIHAIYPFQAPDGTWGCVFKLDPDGRVNLEAVSTSRRGTFLCGFIATKKGSHRLPELMIDRSVTDGILSIPRGFTALEIDALSKEFKVLGGVNRAQPSIKYRMWNPFRKKEPESTAPTAPALPS